MDIYVCLYMPNYWVVYLVNTINTYHYLNISIVSRTMGVGS